MESFNHVELKPGQFIFGRRSAAEDLKMSEQSIRTSLKFLENEGNLTIKTTSKYSVISITNWEAYQGADGAINQPINQPLTNEQQTNNHKQERKKVEKETKQRRVFSPEVEALYTVAVKHFGAAGHKTPKTEPAAEKWKDVFRLMVERDSHPPTLIAEVLEFVRGDVQTDGEFPGWGAVTQSPAGLRKHLDKILNQMNYNRAAKPAKSKRERELEMYQEV